MATNNTVREITPQNKIIVNTADETQIQVVNPVTNVVQVVTLGPQGPKGEAAAAASTGSLLVTASIDNNTITFTKGDTSTFSISLASGSFTGSFTGNLIGTASWSTYSNTSSYIDPVFISASAALYGFGTGTQINTGSFVLTSSFNEFTSSTDIRLLNLTNATSSYITNSQTSSMTVLSSSYAISSSMSFLQSSILTNITVGALASGTSLNSGSAIENILRQMLITYIAPTISGLTMKSGATTYSTSTVFEPSQSFNVSTASWTAANDNPDGNPPQSISLTGSNAFIGTQQFSGLTGTNYNFVGGGLNFSRYTSGSIVFRLNALDKNGSAISAATATFNFQWPWYYGITGSANTDIDEGGVEALTKILASTNSAAGTRSLTNGSSVYVYIAVPSVFPMFNTVTVAGTSLVFNNISPYTTAQTSGNTGYTYKTLSVTNANGATINYRVYRSLNTFASLTTSDSIVIT
jgi:hypothetical protein